MSEINIFGFPKSMKKSKIFHILKNMVFGKRLRCKFWVHDIVPDSDPNFVVVLMNIVKKNDASKAINLINDFVYYDVQNKINLSAVNVTNHLTLEEYNECMPVENEEQSKRDREARQSNRLPAPDNSRSRSPHLTNDVTKLDMEIQLIRKERLLVIEQRKLLLEKKRLELLKEFEPSSINDLEMYTAAIAKHTFDNDQLPIPQKVVPNKSAKLKGATPMLASRAIVKQIKDATSKRPQTRGMLARPLYFAIKNRIGELVRGKSQLQPDDIVRLYREIYPVETDEALLDQIEAQIKQNAQAVNNGTAGGVKGNFNEVETNANISGQSNSDKGEITNKRQDEKSKDELVNEEVTDSAALLDAELDDWLEDDAEKDSTTDIQQVGDIKEKEDTKDILELDDDEKEDTNILQQDINDLEEKGEICI